MPADGGNVRLCEPPQAFAFWKWAVSGVGSGGAKLSSTSISVSSLANAVSRLSSTDFSLLSGTIMTKQLPGRSDHLINTGVPVVGADGVGRGLWGESHGAQAGPKLI